MKSYKPKKKKYNTLGQLNEEMRDSGVVPVSFTGIEILTKTHRYGLVDGQITIRER